MTSRPEDSASGSLLQPTQGKRHAVRSGGSTTPPRRFITRRVINGRKNAAGAAASLWEPQHGRYDDRLCVV